MRADHLCTAWKYVLAQAPSHQLSEERMIAIRDLAPAFNLHLQTAANPAIILDNICINLTRTFRHETTDNLRNVVYLLLLTFT